MSRRQPEPCAGMLDVMFPEEKAEDGRRRPEYAEEVEYAKGFCTACSARVECLSGALVRKEEYGIWGGTTPGERKTILLQIKRRTETAA